MQYGTEISTTILISAVALVWGHGFTTGAWFQEKLTAKKQKKPDKSGSDKDEFIDWAKSMMTQKQHT